MPSHFCQAGGRLVGADELISSEPSAYGHEAAGLYIGCSSLRCRECDGVVKQQAGLRDLENLRQHLTALAEQKDWASLPFFEASASTRIYACACHAWAEASSRFLDDREDDDPIPAPVPPWRCGGHPVAKLPITVDGESIDVDTDWNALVQRVADGWVPRIATATERDLRVTWLTKLYSWLLDTPSAAFLSRAVAEEGVTDREGAAGQAMLFFRRFPRADGFEMVLKLAEASGATTGLEYRYARRMGSAAPRDALIARLESAGEELDATDRDVVAVLRADLLDESIPVASSLLIAVARDDAEWLAWSAPRVVTAHPELTESLLETLRALQHEDLVVIAGVALARNVPASRDRLARWLAALEQAGASYTLVIDQSLRSATPR